MAGRMGAPRALRHRRPWMPKGHAPLEMAAAVVAITAPIMAMSREVVAAPIMALCLDAIVVVPSRLGLAARVVYVMHAVQL